MGKGLILAALLLAGCAHVQPIENARKVWCDNNAPRRPTVAVLDAMSRPELDELNAHNAKGVRWCNWQP